MSRVADVYETAIPAARVTIVYPGRLMELRFHVDSLFEHDTETLRPAQRRAIAQLVSSLSSPPPGLRYETEAVFGISAAERLLVSEDRAMRRAGVIARAFVEEGAPRQAVVDALSRSLNPTIDDAARSGSALKKIAHVAPRDAAGLPYLASLFEAVVADTPQLKAAAVRLLDDRLVLSLPADALFADGGTVIAPAAKPVISSISEVLNGLTNQIAVAAHTSPMLEGGSAYASNWEFSLARAGAIANYLKSVGVSQPIRIYGMADGHFANLPDLPPADRLALARRIEIVILPSWRTGS